MFRFRNFSLLACAGVAAISFAAAGCVSTSADRTPRVKVETLSPPELSKRAEGQAKLYKEAPHDVANAVAYAETLGAQNKHEQQQAILEKLVMNHGATADIQAAYGKSLIANGEYARADQVLAQAFQPDQPDWKTLSARGVANDKLGNHKEAQALYEAALRVHPNEPSVLTNLGLSYAYRRDYGKAEHYLRSAMSQPGADPRIERNLAVILGMQGKTNQQQAALAKVASQSDANDALLSASQIRIANASAPRSPGR